MMGRRCQITSLLLLATLTLSACSGELPKPGYTRTMLKVSRSLPGETEELKVRTSEGNLATLIVKRRDKSSLAFNNTNSVPKLPQEESNVTAASGSDSSTSVQSESKLNDDGDEVRKKKEEVRKLEKAQVEQIKATFSKFTEPKNEKTNDTDRTNETAIFEKSQIINDDNLRSEIVSAIDHGKWTPLDANGRALKQTEEPDEVEEYRDWKPLPPEYPKTTERTNYGWFNKAEIGDGILFARNFQDRIQRNLELENESGNKNERAFYYTYIPHESRPSTRTNIGANLSKNRDGKHVPPEVTIRSEINVKAVPKRSSMSLDSDGTPVIHGTRVPDDPIDKIQTWRNARVINNKLVSAEGENPAIPVEPSVGTYSTDGAETRQKFEKFFKDVNRRYSRDYDEGGRNVYFEWDPRNYKNDALKAEVYEPRNDHYRASVHKRMLHPDGIANYPISQRYTPDSQTIAPVALKPGARTPVLQYAHPELGVQPAKIVKNEKRRPENNFPESQYSFTEQRYKKKYVLNDKNIVDSYTVKNYYPNQHFYGLRRPNEPPFWVKISENLRNQFSTGVERVSQFTRPVIDPLVEATHKISQNLGLSNGKEAQDKIGTVASGTSILIPALGLVASGAALGIGAVAVGRYLDVDVLKRSNVDDLEHKRALEAGPYLRTIEDENGGSSGATLQTLYVLQNVPQEAKATDESAGSTESDDGVFLVLEEDKRNAERTENRESKQTVDEGEYVETGGRRRKRSLDYLDIFKTETDMRNLVRDKRFQRKGADSISEIVEIDLPAGSSRVDITEFLIPQSKRKHSNKDTVLIIEDSSKIPSGRLGAIVSSQNALENSGKIVEDDSQRNDPEKKTVKYEEDDADFREEDNGRRKRSVEIDQELMNALQNLENAEVTEVAHVEGDWSNTPCAKRIFCDAMIQRGHDATMLMEKKMAALLRLINGSPITLGRTEL